MLVDRCGDGVPVVGAVPCLTTVPERTFSGNNAVYSNVLCLLNYYETCYPGSPGSEIFAFIGIDLDEFTAHDDVLTTTIGEGSVLRYHFDANKGGADRQPGADTRSHLTGDLASRDRRWGIGWASVVAAVCP
jgi:hypothetical protein